MSNSTEFVRCTKQVKPASTALLHLAHVNGPIPLERFGTPYPPSGRRVIFVLFDMCWENFNVIFESQLGSAGTYVKIYEEATHNQYHVGSTGQFLKFEPDTMRTTLGLSKLQYSMDFSKDPYFPQEVEGDTDMRFESASDPFQKSFRIQARNLPVKSYNGSTGNSDFTIATLDINKEVSECLNKYDAPLNEIQVEITDEANTLATNEFQGDTQITLEITPHLAV